MPDYVVQCQWVISWRYILTACPVSQPPTLSFCLLLRGEGSVIDDTHCSLCEYVVKYPCKIWQFDAVMRNEEWSKNINHVLGSLQPQALKVLQYVYIICVYLCVDTFPFIMHRKPLLSSLHTALQSTAGCFLLSAILKVQGIFIVPNSHFVQKHK